MTTSAKKITANPFATEMPKPTEVPLFEDQCVCMKFITQFTGRSDKWFYKLIKEDKFPKPIKLGRRSVWLKSEVENWFMKLIFESRGGVKS